MANPLGETVFLVSGGGRGVTAQCVRALAAAHGGSFILLGRTALDGSQVFDGSAPDANLKREIAAHLLARGEKAVPSAIERTFRAVRARRDIASTLETIEATGARVAYLATDVTDTEALRAGVAATGLGPVTGIIHGAGVLSDKRIEDKTAGDFATVYATKIHGLRSMLACVDADRLAYLALFSSIAGYYGNRGQADYAIANEVLNKFAHAFRHRVPSCHTVVFDWGPWDGGMVSPQLKSLFAARGVRVMAVAEGAQRFVETLADPAAPAQLLINDPGLTPEPGPAMPLRRMTRHLRQSDNPFLEDHVINGSPVLPAACAALWMANSGQQSRPGYRFFGLDDVRVLKGIVFDAGLAGHYVAEIREADATDAGVTQKVVISSTTAEGKPRYHYSGTVRLVRTTVAPPIAPRVDLAIDPQFDGFQPYAAAALFHGPTFRAISRVLSVTADRITVECRRPPSEAARLGQFPAVAFDPVCLDALFQSVGLWAQQRLAAAALPSSCGRFEWYAPPRPADPFYITAEIATSTARLVRATISMHDAVGRVFARAAGVELTIRQPPPRLKVTPPAIPRDDRSTEPDARSITRVLRDVDRTCFVVQDGGRVTVTRDERQAEVARREGRLLAHLPPTPPSRLGAASFRDDYRVRYAYMAGAMAKGIAAEELVIAVAREGILGSFGAGGLTLERIEQAIVRVQQALPSEPYAFNLLHSPRKLRTEDGTAALYVKHRVRVVEASSYLDLTPSIVWYRLAGLMRRGDGRVVPENRVIVKLSRVELAARFMRPAPSELVRQLLDAGRLTPEQAALAAHVPIADDITVEADSGGHTDNRPLVALLPAMLTLRDEIQRERRYPAPIRIGAAGGIATPQAVLAAFTMGADCITTGSINQACIEAGTSAYVKSLLGQVTMTDVAMAPESDMFESGVRVQVVKHRTLFPMRAQKLFECYQAYDSLEAIPEPVRRQLEQQIFKAPLEAIWEQTAEYLAAHKPEQLRRAAQPKVKLALLFKWYLGQSSRWAAQGVDDRQLDYQIWCGPGMGAFNAWARGTYLESPANRRVADVARVLMSEAAYLHRLHTLKVLGVAGPLFAGAVPA